VQAALDEIASALPEAAAVAFVGDRAAVVHDLYPVLVDQIARDRLRADGVRLAAPRGRARATALDLFLEGLTAVDPVLPRHSGYSALDRRLAAWVDEGLGRRSSTRWRIGLHLDATPTRSCSSCGSRPRTIRRSACPPRFCGAATTTSSPSCATATRAGT
jgi:hypothetical protein